MRVSEFDGEQFFEDVNFTDTPCISVFSNQTKASANAVITASGCQFFYSDDSKSKKQARFRELKAGQSLTISSPYSKKCVEVVQGGIEYTANGKKAKAGQQYTREDDEPCLDEVHFILMMADDNVILTTRFVKSQE